MKVAGDSKQSSWEFDADKLATSVMVDGKRVKRRGMEPYMYNESKYQRQVHDSDGLTHAWRNKFFRNYIGKDMDK